VGVNEDVGHQPRTLDNSGASEIRESAGAAEVGRRDMEGVYMKRLLRKSRSRFNFFFKIRYWLRIGPKVRLATPIIGRYKRDEMKPFIEAAAKMAQILDVSLDWLAGHTDLELDKKMIQRIQQVTKMSEKDREHVFAMLDAFIKQTKLQSIM
jgi:transcriptional regulator with XRE-family HTH domain